MDSKKSGALEILKRVRPAQNADDQKHIDRFIAVFKSDLKTVKKAQAGGAAAAVGGGGGGAKADHHEAPKQFGQMIQYADLKYEKKVGEGAFGCVFVGTWKGQQVAIKELKAQGVPQEALQDMLQEGLVMMQLRHANVMHVHGICTQPGHYGLIMQFIPGGSVEDLLKKQTNELSWQRRATIALRISRGMNYLHANKILHRDLKSPNILLEANDNPRITDFGLVKVKTATATIAAKKNEAAGTVIFMAPELFEPKATFRSASDVYSFAMVLFEIAARQMPWINTPGLTHALLMGAVCAGKRPEIPATTPPSFSKIMKRCWAQRIEDRPNFEKIEDDLEACRAGLNT